MAGIDHTIICFHNGKLMRSLYKPDGDSYESAIPFEYSRDAELIKPKASIKKIIPYECSTGRFRQWFGEHFMELLPREYIGYFHEDDIRIFTYQSENYNTIFYLKDDESYTMLGGYGHYDNVYTHFFLSVDMEKSLKEKWLRSVITGYLERCFLIVGVLYLKIEHMKMKQIFSICKKSFIIKTSGI